MEPEVLKSIVAGKTRNEYTSLATEMEQCAKCHEKQALKLLAQASGYRITAWECRELAKKMKEGIEPAENGEDLPELEVEKK